MAQGKMRKRAKTMLPAIRLLITTRALTEPDKGREILADELIEDIKRQFPKEVPPAWETVIKLISQARNAEGSPLEKPWQLASLADYELNPAVVPMLLQEQVRRAKENYVPLRIREALWASRLCSTIAALLSDKPESIARAVIYWAGQYAATEGFSFYAGTDFNTSELDKTLLNAPEPIEGALTVVYLPTSVFRHSFRRKKTDVVSNGNALKENSKRGYTK